MPLQLNPLIIRILQKFNCCAKRSTFLALLAATCSFALGSTATLAQEAQTQEPATQEAVATETMETITVPLGQQSPEQASVSRPDKGMSKAMVMQSFGEPTAKLPNVGTPPISSWVYSNFVVYFESDFVIHTVLKHKAPGSQANDKPANNTP